MTKWWWIRHAPVAQTGVIYGHTDYACDCSDAITFATLSMRLPTPGVVICSNLSRSRQTFTTLVSTGWAAPEPLVESAFAEQDFGAWEGVTWESLRATANTCYVAFWDSPFTVRPPCGESFIDVVTRVSKAIIRISYTYIGCDIVAIAHAGSIRAALTLALDLNPNQVHTIDVDYLSVTRLEYVSGMWRVRTINS